MKFDENAFTFHSIVFIPEIILSQMSSKVMFFVSFKFRYTVYMLLPFFSIMMCHISKIGNIHISS